MTADLADMTALELPLGTSRWSDDESAELRQPTPRSIAGVPVSLRDAQGNEIARTTTDRTGRYRFDDLPGVDYSVVFTAPSGGHDEPTRTPIQTWTSGPTGYRLVGTLT
jgi:hypothetical protein